MTDHLQDAVQTAQHLTGLIATLDAANSTMTSLISLALPPAVLLAVISKLADEHRAASHIKSVTNRVALTSAIALVQAKLGEFTQMPANGVYVYCGKVYGGPNQEEQVVSVSYEPPVPVKQFQYLCDKVFHTDVLVDLLEEVGDAEVVDRVRLQRERKLLVRLFDEQSTGSGKCCFGVRDTLKALDIGAVETLIVWDQLDLQRYVLKNPVAATGNKHLVKHLTPAQEQEQEHFVHDGQELEIVDKLPLLAWFTENVSHFGATLVLVPDRSQEGARFVGEFGGIAGLLRYVVELGQ